MKFYCDACNTKYSIPDEKVQGKVLKVRCKSCGNVITVKEQVAPSSSGTEPTMMGSRPVPPPPPPQSVGPTVPPNNWHYSVNGQAAGPFQLKALRERFASGSLGDEAYVWHEILVAWKPVREVPAFHDALAKGQTIRPRAKTLGFTGPLEAIKVDGPQPKGKKGGEVPSLGETVEVPRLKTDPPIAQKTPELRPKAQTPVPAPREDRLEKLREKLKNDVPAPAFKPSLDLPKPSAIHSDSARDLPEEDTAKITFEQAAPRIPAPEKPAPQKPALQKPALPSFELKPFSAALFDQVPAEEELSDPLDQWASEEPETTEDSGLIPFFDDAPKLGAPSTSVAPTGSLLLQLDSIQKEGRSKKFVGVAVVLVVLFAASGIGVYLSRQAPEERPIVAVTTEKRVAPVEKVYSKQQLTGLGIELEEEILVESEGEAEEEEPVVAAATASPKSTLEATRAPAEKKVKTVDEVIAKTAPKQQKQSEGNSDSGPAAPVNAQSVLNYSNPTAVQRSTSPTINRPDDKIAAQTPTTLTTESAREGFQIIRRSVEQCRARHMRRGAKLDANKISVRVTVEPSGTVSKYVLEPSTVANTEFDLCMGSHRDRWRFARWDGDATEVASSFVLN